MWHIPISLDIIFPEQLNYHELCHKERERYTSEIISHISHFATFQMFLLSQNFVLSRIYKTFHIFFSFNIQNILNFLNW
jgi:hypothetical protein